MTVNRCGLRLSNCLLIVNIFTMSYFQNLYSNCLKVSSINNPVIPNPNTVHVF